MGNTNRRTKDSPLTTWKLAQYTSLNREQLLDLRDFCLQQPPHQQDTGEKEGEGLSSVVSDKNGHKKKSELPDDEVRFLSQARLKDCLQAACIKTDPDGEIICDLHTMWHADETYQIPTMDFLIGLCPLACEPGCTARTFFQFVMEFLDVQDRRRVAPKDLFRVLESKSPNTLFTLYDGQMCFQNSLRSCGFSYNFFNVLSSNNERSEQDAAIFR